MDLPPDLPLPHDPLGLLDGAEARAAVLIVCCSDDFVTAAAVTPCSPALVLQTFGGTGDLADASTRAALEYAIEARGVRHVIVCGHLRCHAVRAARGVDPRAIARRHALQQVRRWRHDAVVGRLLDEHGVKVRAVWVDDADGHVHACDADEAEALS